MRHWIYKLVSLLGGAICLGCSSTAPAPDSSGSGPAPVDRSSLVGVWEVTKYLQTYGTPPARFASNVKYCFTESRAYFEIAPEAATDTRDGWWAYEIEGDMLVVKQPAEESILQYRMLSPTEMTLTQNGLQMTLRKISPTVDASRLSVPVLPRKALPIEGLPPPTPAASPAPTPSPTAAPAR